MLMVMIVVLAVILQFIFTPYDDGDGGIIENPWMILPQLFCGSFIAGVLVPMLMLYWNENMRNHCLGLVSNIFPRRNDMIDVIV